jgi:hypothetical protein
MFKTVELEAPAAIRMDIGAIFVSLELSRSTWLLTSVSPGAGEKMSQHATPAGDLPRLFQCLAELKRKALARTGKTYSIIVIQEAGLDGFWIHRALEREGIESHVADAASIAVPRRRRRAKTDRIDGKTLLRTLMAFKRGEPRVKRRGGGSPTGRARAQDPDRRARRTRQSDQGPPVHARGRRLPTVAPRPASAARGAAHGRGRCFASPAEEPD